MSTEYTPEKVADIAAWLLRNHGSELSPLGRDYTDAEIADALTAVSAERDAAIREMHARELHHFEEEQRAAELAAVIERAKGLFHGDGFKDSPLGRLLHAVPADVLRERDAETLLEAARFLRDLHSEYEAAETLEMYARETKEQD